MLNGILNIYKEKGYTSHDVVAILRKILKTKKIGHTGTLDPEAEGVLPICIGKAAKAVEYMIDKDKTYQAQMLLGVATDTQDHTGKTIRTEKVTATVEEIIYAVNSFIGSYDQLPPMFSAVKVNGKKLYELAREGLEIERKSRLVTIRSIDKLQVSGSKIAFEVVCSKGTYIRTLCHDIGIKLGCGAHMTSLTRIKSGPFSINESYKLEQIKALAEQEAIDKILISVDNVFMKHPSLEVKREYHKAAYNGNKLQTFMLDGIDTLNSDSLYRLYDADSSFLGLYRFNDGILKPEKIFF